MTPGDAVRAAQVAAMTDPDRVQLLALVLSAPLGQVTIASLAGPDADDQDRVAAHLRAMHQVGLLSEGGGVFSPTHDALARFGSLAGEQSERRERDYGDHERLLEWIVEDLARRHEGVLARETVREFVLDSYDLLASRAKVRMHLPQLTSRFAGDRLEALASLAIEDPRVRDDVLFVCVKNAGRAQIAAALMRSRAGDALRIRTAGSVPAVQLDPVVRSELARLGVDGLTEFPRPLTSEVVRASGVVVTMGCGDACPIVPGRRYVDWPVEDPVGLPASEVRRIVADIGERVSSLLVELGVMPGSTTLRGRLL
jgi:protein-tyrosine-phosphatase